MPVGYVYDVMCLGHDTGNHPENASRLRAIMAHLRQSELFGLLSALPSHRASLEDIYLVHDAAHVDRVRRASQGGGGYLTADTVVSERSFAAALHAAGGAISATRAVLEGEMHSAFALIRPPGHHATRKAAMGFCLINNIAVAAAWALRTKAVSRLAIVDFDVHHGNGTQETFEADPRVLYISTHQSPLYPGTGHWRETGTGPGVGTCLNIPLPPETGDTGYRRAFTELVGPALRRFQPEAILISAGYDAHWSDPLAWMLLSLTGYHWISEYLVATAREVCGGRLVFVLEGGYDPDVLANGVAGTLAAATGVPHSDPLGPAREPEPDIAAHLERIARWHGL